MHNVGQALSGQVSIGFAPGTAASSITMPLLQAVRADSRRSLYYLHENSGAVLNEKLINHQLDMAVIYEHSPVAGVSSQALLKEDLFLVGTQDCPGQSVDVNAIAQMNLFLPSDYSAVSDFVLMAFSLRRLTAKVIGEIESIATLTAAIASGMGVAVVAQWAARSFMWRSKWVDVTHYHAFHESLFVIKFTRQSELIATGTGSERVVNVSD